VPIIKIWDIKTKEIFILQEETLELEEDEVLMAIVGLGDYKFASVSIYPQET
jgi:hypothetical protein